MNARTAWTRLAVAAATSAAWLCSNAQEIVVKVGYTGPLSGGAALYGKNVLEGMQMAAEEINSEGLTVADKKLKVEIVALDDKYNPSESAINAQRLVQEYKAPVILVPHSGGTYAMQTTNEQLKYLIVSYTSVPQVTSRGNKLTLRIPPDFNAYVPIFVRHAMSKYGRKLAIACADHDYAKAWIAAFKPAWEAAGGTVVADNPMSYTKATDFYSGVSRSLAAKPDVMLVGGPSEPTGLVVKQARELGFKGGFVMIDQARFDEMARVLGSYGPLNGSIGVLPVTEIKAGGVPAFIERFRKRHEGRLPTWEHTLNYSGVRLVAEAMRQAGSATDAAAIRAKLDAAARALVAKPANPHDITGVTDQGSSSMSTQAGVVENDKPVPIAP